MNDIPMLERLNQVDWQKLTHAFGSASDVPDQIHNLASADAEKRKSAMYELYGNIWHQGTVYQATAYAVPFLIELLEVKDVSDKHEILILLAHLATGRSYKDVHQHLAGLREPVDTPEWQTELQQELAWVKDAKNAVALGMPVYLRMLSHPKVPVRDAASYALASLGEAAKNAAEEVLQRISVEGDEAARTSLIRTFGILDRGNERTEARIVALMSGEQPKAVRLAAAMALVGIVRAAAPPEAIALLIDAVQHPEDYSSLQRSCWQMDDTVGSTVSCFMATLEGAAALAAEEALLHALSSEKSSQALTIAEALLQLAFRGPIDPKAMITSFSERQQRVLKALAAAGNLWGVTVKGTYMQSANTSLVIQSYNLPGYRPDFEAFVRGERAAKTAPMKKRS